MKHYALIALDGPRKITMCSLVAASEEAFLADTVVQRCIEDLVMRGIKYTVIGVESNI